MNSFLTFRRFPAAGCRELQCRSKYHTRHTFPTLMLSAGENVGWVQRLMGHTSLRMIQERHYRYIPNLTHLDGSVFSARFQKELARIFHELLSRDHEHGRVTWQPQGVGSEAYLNSTSQGPTPEDARKDGHIRGRSK